MLQLIQVHSARENGEVALVTNHFRSGKKHNEARLYASNKLLYS